jgi:hypothetical protein
MARETIVLHQGKWVTKSIDGVITEDYLRLVGHKKVNPFDGYGSDNIGGSDGVFNHADGKRYDSKSQYERAVRANGCRVVGNDLNNQTWKTPLERGVSGDFNARAQLQQAIQKVMG